MVDKTIFNDAIHGQIDLNPLLMQIIQTTEFQRLRYVKQSSIKNYVFPCANHTRFEHSIGTCYLGGQLVRHLKEQDGNEFNITDVDVLCVEIAGLLHDVGHGPFSHLFEELIQKLKPQSIWKHEEMSLKIIDRIFEKIKSSFLSNGIAEREIEMIKDMIYFDGEKGHEKMKKLHDKWSIKNGNNWNKVFLFEIVSNHRNGIDVDKFDYFERDSLYFGLKSNFNAQKYIKNSKILIVNDLPQICLRDIVVCNLYEMYHIREQLHRTAYQHKVCFAIERMLIDALVEANQYYHFDEIVENYDLESYILLNDTIYIEILNSRNQIELKESKEILRRIENRNLYKYVSETIIADDTLMIDLKNNEFFDQMKLEILQELEKHKMTINDPKMTNIYNKLNTNEIFISKNVFDYGDEDKNPIEKVQFYSKNEMKKSFKIKSNQVSLMLPRKFQEIILRLYCKTKFSSENEKHDCISVLKNAFISWTNAKNEYYQKQVFSTPL